MDRFVDVLVAVIGAVGVSAGPIAVVLIQKGRKEQRILRKENDRQHGNSMAVIREIELTTKEIAVDVRELRNDFEDHLDDHVIGVVEDKHSH